MKVEEIEKLIRLSWKKLLYTGGKLYQYRSCKGYNLANLENGVITLNKISSFNDLWEGRFEYSTEEVLSQSKFGKFLSKDIVEEIIGINFNANRNNIYAACLSERNDSELMWAHYTENYTGYIIEFDYAETYKKIQPQNAAIFPIIYSNETTDFTKLFIKLIDVYCENLSKNVDHINAEVKAVIASNDILPKEAKYVNILKKPIWSYEAEWRIMKTCSEEAERIPISINAISIYLGSKITKDNKDSLIRIASMCNLSVYQMGTNIKGMYFDKIL